jgi:hypothetical protein
LSPSPSLGSQDCESRPAGGDEEKVRNAAPREAGRLGAGFGSGRWRWQRRRREAPAPVHLDPEAAALLLGAGPRRPDPGHPTRFSRGRNPEPGDRRTLPCQGTTRVSLMESLSPGTENSTLPKRESPWRNSSCFTSRVESREAVGSAKRSSRARTSKQLMKIIVLAHTALRPGAHTHTHTHNLPPLAAQP